METTVYTRFKALDAELKPHVEEKNGLTYLSWAWAVEMAIRECPNMTYKVRTFNGLPYVYDATTGYMVYTEVTIDGVTREMWLPVMDGANRAMKAEPYNVKRWNPKERKWDDVTVAAATMFDINKTIMRCLTKNLAMFGLGLTIYAGEDLPDEAVSEPGGVTAPQKDKSPRKSQRKAIAEQPSVPSNKRSLSSLSGEKWNKAVERAAKGLLGETGATAREWLINNYEVTEKILEEFDNCVLQYRINNSI